MLNPSFFIVSSISLMGISRKIPNTIVGRQMAMSKAKKKKDSAKIPSDNILSDATSQRLEDGLAAYDKGIKAIMLTKTAYHRAVELAIPQRSILKTYITSFHDSLNSCINRGTILPSARGFYDLDITNRRLPIMTSDDDLLIAGATVLSGDLLRINNGGIAMSGPTIAAYTLVYNKAKPLIEAINNTHTDYTTATSNLRLQITEIDDLIKHIWNEVEGYYSLISPSSRRVQCRLWGVRYISVGTPSVVTGNCKNELGEALAGVKVRIVGANNSTESDALGNFSLNTGLYGNLELLASLQNYEPTITDLYKENGEEMAVAIIMERA